MRMPAMRWSCWTCADAMPRRAHSCPTSMKLQTVSHSWFGCAHSVVYHDAARPSGLVLPLVEAEWEYACRAGTTGPFNLDHSVSADEVNYYGHYPYEIEGNYFDQEVLDVKPGVYRGEPVASASFVPNAWGLYDMHGNVAEWVRVSRQSPSSHRARTWARGCPYTIRVGRTCPRWWQTGSPKTTRIRRSCG